MTYNPKYNEKSKEYRKAHFKRVGVDFNKDYYENTLKPATDAVNKPVGTFIKEAVAEKIERDNILGKVKCK